MAMTPTEEIMMMGQRADVPMGNPQAPAPQDPAPQAPAPQDPMAAPQDPMAALMGNEMALGGGGMERPMPEEAGMSIEQDAGDLVEAIVGRVEGNIETAVAILDTAKAMLLAGGQEQQQMPMMEPEVGAADIQTSFKTGGKIPKYAANGRYLSDTDNDVLRQMIMDNLTQSGRTMSDRDSAQSGRTMSDKDLALALTQAGRRAQAGRTLSDKDKDYFVDMRLK